MHKKLRPSGGYRDTASFQTTTLIYDATVWFCEKFLDARSRTVDQMVQAARSGRQNIAEGSRAAASSQTELRLVNVARASLEELLLDYEDFLRQRRLPQWAMDDPEASAVRRVPRDFKDQSDPADLDGSDGSYGRAALGIVCPLAGGSGSRGPGECPNLPYPPSQFSTGPADRVAGAGLCAGRRLQ